MCAIIGSFSKDKMVELVELNRYRGEHSFSISYYDPYEKKFGSIYRSLGSIDCSLINIPEGQYCVVHQQAPTTENATAEFIHPAEIHGQLLWHNGILKSKTIEFLQIATVSDSTWDSWLLLKYIYDTIYLENIDGTFSCLYYDFYCPALYLFRNRLAPMFYDDDMNISSTRFEGCKKLPPEKVFLFYPEDKIIKDTGFTFETKNNPYRV